MWTEKLAKPMWLEGGQAFARDWQRGAKRFIVFLLAACDPRLGQSAGDDGVAWLNGLRGFAAFLVYCAHHSQFVPHGDKRALWHSFGYDGEYYFASLPFVRLFCGGGGRIAVALFFAISGFVLSYSPLRTIQSRPDGIDHQLATRIGTSFARRWLRLFLPVIVTTFVYMASWHLFNVRSAELKAAEPAATFRAETVRWFNEFMDGSYVFHTLNAFANNDYNPHMWSIAVEYRGSLLVYVWCLAMFAVGYSPRKRFWATLGLFIYFHMAVGGHWYAGFVMGMLICDLTIVSELNPSQLPKLFRLQFFRKYTWPYYVLFFAGIYLGSVPHPRNIREMSEEPGWYYLTRLVPASTTDVTWYFAVFSAALLVTSIPNIRWLKRIFESEPSQYLGKISFGLYLVHGPLMWTVGDRIYAAVGRPSAGASLRIPGWMHSFPISDKGPLGLELNSILPHVILLPLTLWCAVVVTKLVDVPSVTLSKYLFGQRKRGGEKSTAQSWEVENLLSQNDGRLPR